MSVLSVMNQKGGCGKTTTAINLSACLAYRGRRVLLVDLDPEQHATIGLRGGHDSQPAGSMTRVVSGTASLHEFALAVSENLDLATADAELHRIVSDAARHGRGQETLARALATARERYDFVVLDCPPASGPLTRCALWAADEVIIAVETSFFALNGVKRLLDLIEESRLETGRPRGIRALATMYDRRTTFAREVLGEIRNYFGEALYDSVIAYTVRLKEASSHGLSIVDYDRSSRAFVDYLSLADEVLQSGARVQAAHERQPERRRSMHG
jgi:chromosome partitioning protein